MVFDHLVFDDAHARFFHRKFCKRNTHLVRRKRRTVEDLVDLFLRISREFFLRCPNAGKQLFKRLLVVHNKVFHFAS